MCNTDIQRIADCCDARLDLAAAKLGNEYFYQSLPLCVIDAVWSIGVLYKGVQDVVERYCEHFGLREFRDGQTDLLSVESQESITEFIDKYNEYGVERFTHEIYQNRQRTAPTNGILKSEAVLMFAKVLQYHKVEHLQDVVRVVNDRSFESDIKLVPGQKSGVSLAYFFMLTGSENRVKPDTRVMAFLEDCLNRTVKTSEAEPLLQAAVSLLKPKYTHLMPRLLDHVIWQYQRTLKTPRKNAATSLQPRRFEVSIGGYFGASFSVSKQSARLVYQKCCCSKMTQGPEMTYTPNADDWKLFWATIDEIGAWDWQLSYHQPVCDGTSWSVEIERGGKILRSSGSNAYPPDGGLETTSEFTTFCKAVSRLIGGREFH
jgi:hypothetical protein